MASTLSRIDINKKQNGVLYPSPVFCSGALSVDEAFTLAQAVCGGNAGTMAFVRCHNLTPAALTQRFWHAEGSWRTRPWRRLMASHSHVRACACVFVCARSCFLCVCALVSFLRGFDVNEVSLNFNDNVHGNDRRKTSQQCYWVKHYATSFRPATDASEVLCVAI